MRIVATAAEIRQAKQAIHAKQAKLFATRRRREAKALPLLLQMKAAGIPTPEQEVKFVRDRDWCFDFAWRGWKIALEVEGGVFTQGRHVRGVGYTEDCRKYSRAAIAGWMLIRATTGMVEDGSAIELLRDAFSARGLE
jgi:hypothetical protein